MHSVTAAGIKVTIAGIQAFISPASTQSIIDHFASHAAWFLFHFVDEIATDYRFHKSQNNLIVAGPCPA